MSSKRKPRPAARDERPAADKKKDEEARALERLESEGGNQEQHEAGAHEPSPSVPSRPRHANL